MQVGGVVWSPPQPFLGMSRNAMCDIPKKKRLRRRLVGEILVSGLGKVHVITSSFDWFTVCLSPF